MIDKARRLGFREWLHGLLSAGITGAAGAISVIIVDPVAFNFTDGKTKLAQVAVAMALVALALYLKDRPLPDAWSGDERRTEPPKEIV